MDKDGPPWNYAKVYVADSESSAQMCSSVSNGSITNYLVKMITSEEPILIWLQKRWCAWKSFLTSWLVIPDSALGQSPCPLHTGDSQVEWWIYPSLHSFAYLLWINYWNVFHKCVYTPFSLNLGHSPRTGTVYPPSGTPSPKPSLAPSKYQIKTT